MACIAICAFRKDQPCSCGCLGKEKLRDCFESSGALAIKNIFARFPRTLWQCGVGKRAQRNERCETNQSIAAGARRRACSISFSERTSRRQCIGVSAASKVNQARVIQNLHCWREGWACGATSQDSGKHSRSLLDLWMRARKCGFQNRIA